MNKISRVIVLALGIATVLIACVASARMYVWEPVTLYGNGQPITNAVTYNVYYQSGTNWTRIGSSTTTNLVWTWPVDGVYTVAVTTVVGIDESPKSIPVVDDARLPGTPLNLRRAP